MWSKGMLQNAKQLKDTKLSVWSKIPAAALQELAADPRFVGGQIGMVGVLQTEVLMTYAEISLKPKLFDTRHSLTCNEDRGDYFIIFTALNSVLEVTLCRP